MPVWRGCGLPCRWRPATIPHLFAEGPHPQLRQRPAFLHQVGNVQAEDARAAQPRQAGGPAGAGNDGLRIGRAVANGDPAGLHGDDHVRAIGGGGGRGHAGDAVLDAGDQLRTEGLGDQVHSIGLGGERVGAAGEKLDSGNPP